MQTEFFRLDILTPVHIGTGEETDPMNYLMRREDGSPVCHILDTNSWARDYPDSDELCEKFSGDNIPQMRKFIADNIDPEIYGVRRIRVSEEGIFREYEQKRDDQRTSNQLRLSPQMCGNERSPVLPGSSLKGALRTAVIDWLDREQRLGLKQNSGDYIRKLEQALGKIGDNVFKQLKISDVEGWSDSTVLVEALELRQKEGKISTPKSKCEVLPGQLQGAQESAVLFGKLSLGDFSKPVANQLTLPGGKSWTWAELATLVNHYLLPRLDAEISKFYRQPHFTHSLPVVEQLRQLLVDAAPGQMFLRVGHYSQVEFVTVRDNQPLTRKGKQGTPLPHGTTRTLANGLFPFGWVRLTPCREEEYRRGMALREAANQRLVQARLSHRLEISREAARLQAVQQEKTLRLQADAEAEARRLAELEAMPPIDRQLLLLASGKLHEHEVVELFNGLEGMSGGDRLKAALAIKELWVSTGKWGKKECSKKQWEKVQKLQAFLANS